jgi:hypothetical protein
MVVSLSADDVDMNESEEVDLRCVRRKVLILAGLMWYSVNAVGCRHARDMMLCSVEAVYSKGCSSNTKKARFCFLCCDCQSKAKF